MSSILRVKLKWNKLGFDDVELDVTKDVKTFKEKVLTLTGVPLDRQKLMAKGAWVGTLKDDADFSKLKLTPNHQILLMGSADVVAAPAQPITFFEDMTSEQKAETGVTTSAGLANLGNTCFLNSTVQCLRHIPELREALASVRNNASPATDISNDFVNSMRQLDQSVGSYTPASFVNKIRAYFPTFAQRSSHGFFMQHDAEEFYNMLVQSLSEGVRQTGADFDSLMSIGVEERHKCAESTDEPTSVSRDRLSKLVCNISNTVAGTTQIDHMHDGIKLALDGTIEKFSSVLGRNAVWNKSQRISALPKYLCVHLMRFFWKSTPDSREQGVKCKIQRPVSFPETFDVYEFCSEALQQKLRANRDIASKKFEEELSSKHSGVAVSAAVEPEPSAQAAAEAMAVDDDEAALQAALAMSVAGDSAPMAVDTSSSSSAASGELIIPGVPAGWSGTYELHGIVSHKGRDADSGHYIGWVRQAPGSRFWWKYDDDKVTEVSTEEVMNLKGGGERDSAYLIFYRAKM